MFISEPVEPLTIKIVSYARRAKEFVNHMKARRPLNSRRKADPLGRLSDGMKDTDLTRSAIKSENLGHSNPGPILKMTEAVVREIYRTIGKRPAEFGGALGGDRETGLITHFQFDDAASRTGATYSPNTDFLNKLFADDWNPKGINLLGFVHSHPRGFRHPSGGDLYYAHQILTAIPELPQLFLPIVMSESDTGRFELLPYGVSRTADFVDYGELSLDIVKINEKEVTDLSSDTGPQFDRDETFRRVRQAYDLPHLSRCRVIYIGVGGAASFAEDLARAGVGQHILIDPDTVSETNIATQQVYRRDIGKAKVDVLADRINDINPGAITIPIKRALDEIDDTSFGRLAFDGFGADVPVRTLLCGLTDDFPAQARVNRLALNFGLPSLCAQVYWQGRGAEVTLTYPGVTEACHRCMLSSRYKAFLEEEFRNNVTSDGTPIFATTRLNAIKGYVALALLHHDTDHERWGTILKDMRNRTLIQICMDPDIASTLGLKAFDDAFGKDAKNRTFFDEPIWLEQKPDNPANGFPTCPECGGTGDLSQSRGTFADTRNMSR